jgi:hypothetical protein
MSSRPSLLQLVNAVQEWINDERVASKPDAERGHSARIASNLLDVIAREIELGATLRNSERRRLAALLGHDADLGALNAALCARIDAGALDWRDRRLLDHLRLTALGKLAIDNPRYWSYQRAVVRVGFHPEAET